MELRRNVFGPRLSANEIDNCVKQFSEDASDVFVGGVGGGAALPEK